jgi:parvulin-like peptidyl-prolyl isomerase
VNVADALRVCDPDLMADTHSSFAWRGIVLALAAAAGCVLLAGCGSSKSASLPANGVVLVGQDVITRGELTDFLKGATATATAQGEAVPKQGTTAYRSFRDEAVAYLVDASMYEQQAIQMGIGVTDKDVAAAIATIKKQEFSGSETKLRASMKTAGVTQAEFNREEKLTLTEQQLQSKLLAPVKVTAADEKSYYAAHKSSYTTKGKLESFAQAQPSIRTTLLKAKQASAITAWEKSTVGSFCAGNITYNPAYKPSTAANDPCSASATGASTSTATSTTTP